MAVVVVVLGRSRNLFSVVVLGGVYSFMMATVLVAMDAVDVAMTEASVGAGVSTVLFLGALYLCDSEEAKPIRNPVLPTAVSLAVVFVRSITTPVAQAVGVAKAVAEGDLGVEVPG